MTLLAPLALWLGALVVVPLAVHLLRRRIGARVAFPATRYLARAEREHSRRLRLRNLLLMAVRVLLILVLAAAAAGPVAGLRFGAASARSHAPTAVAIVLDNSLSSSLIVQGDPILEQLRRAARNALASVSQRDRVWLLTVDGDVIAGDRAHVADGLDRVTTFTGRARLDRAVARATALLESASMPDRVLLILSDGQASTWASAVNTGRIPITIFAPNIPSPANRSVVSATADPVRWTPRGSVRARITGADSATYRIALAGRTLARGTAESDAAIVVTASPGERGWLTGAVELEPDEMRADDVRHFGVWIGAPPAVSVDRAAGPFVASAIEVLKEAGRATSGTEVAIVAAENVRARPALIVAPSAPVHLGAANRALERAGIPWRFGPASGSRTTVRGGSLDGVDVASRYRLDRLPGALSDTLARAGTEPWVVAGDGYVIVASTVDPSTTTLPVRAVFVPWLAEILSQRLGSAPGPITTTTPGERLAVPRGADALVRPDGSRIPVQAALIDAPRRTGGYRWLAADTTVGVLAVNPDSSESRLVYFGEGELRARVRSSAKATVVTDAAAVSAAVFVSSFRTELATPLLVLGLLLLLAELLLAGERRPRPATGASPRGDGVTPEAAA